jgi:ribonuclease HI
MHKGACSLGAKKLWHYGKPLTHDAECIALWQALEWLTDISEEPMLIEMECQHVVNSVQR